MLISLSASFAALLWADRVGLFGILMRSVTQRTREIGIASRLASQRNSVIRMILLSILKRVCLGVAIGSILAYASSRLMQSSYINKHHKRLGIFGGWRNVARGCGLRRRIPGAAPQLSNHAGPALRITRLQGETEMNTLLQTFATHYASCASRRPSRSRLLSRWRWALAQTWRCLPWFALVLLKPLPFKEPERLVAIYENSGGEFMYNVVAGGVFASGRSRIAASPISLSTTTHSSISPARANSFQRWRTAPLAPGISCPPSVCNPRGAKLHRG